MCLFVCLFVQIVLKRWKNKNRNFKYSGVRVIASCILHEIFWLIGELHFMMSSYSKTNDLLQTAIHSILDH